MKKALCILISIVFILALMIPCVAADDHPAFLTDKAGLLSESEAAELNSMLSEKSEKLQFTIAVVTIRDSSVTDDNIRDYTADLYDYSGYGYGAEHNGCLLLLNDYDRGWYIVGTGSGIQAINSEAIYIIFDQMKDDLKDNNYYGAFTTYADMAEKCVGFANSGKPLDNSTRKEYGYAEKFKLNTTALCVSLIAGIVIAIVVRSMIKSKYKPVKFNANAQDYLVNGSLKLTNQYDHFLYVNVSRVRKANDSSKGGTFTSSSGTSHSGGGGHY